MAGLDVLSAVVAREEGAALACSVLIDFCIVYTLKAFISTRTVAGQTFGISSTLISQILTGLSFPVLKTLATIYSQNRILHTINTKLRRWSRTPYTFRITLTSVIPYITPVSFPKRVA